MNAKAFCDSLWRRYYEKYEGPLKVIRNKWFEFQVGSPQFIKAFQQSAVIELMGGESFLAGVVKYTDIDYHLRTKIARQGFDEMRHHELLRDFVRDLGHDVPEDAAAAMRPFFMEYTATDKMHFLLANIGEKSTDNFFEELEDHTSNARLKEICHDINVDEGFHMELLDEKMVGLCQDQANRPKVEQIFVERWTGECKSIVALSRELGLNVDAILADAGMNLAPGIL
jgi:hypothetical protein